MKYEIPGVYISAREIVIGEGVKFGKNIDIRCVDKFAIGDRSVLGDDVRIRGRMVLIGKDLYHSQGLDVGGGGCDRPNSVLTVGDRCTIHDNHINIAEEVIIGSDVGLSPAVTIYTHGFWLSVLRGFPAEFRPVIIEDGVIIGYRTLVLPGVIIEKECVVGAQSVVTKSLPARKICAGDPAKVIKEVREPGEIANIKRITEIIGEYKKIAQYHGISPEIWVEYPFIQVNQCKFNVWDLTCTGEEDEETDDFRDAMRRYGLRFYTERPFRSALRWK